MRFLIFLLAAAALWAQSDGITVTATRSVFVQADQIEVNITVTTPTTTTQQQVSDALQSAGLPGRLVSATTGQALALPDRTATSLSYSFLHYATGTDLREVTRKLEALRTARSTTITRVTYDASLSPSQSLIDEQFQRTLPQLIADGKKKAEALAAAGGLRVGNLITVSESPSLAVIPALRLGATLQLGFTVQVKFATN